MARPIFAGVAVLALSGFTASSVPRSTAVEAQLAVGEQLLAVVPLPWGETTPVYDEVHSGLEVLAEEEPLVRESPLPPTVQPLAWGAVVSPEFRDGVRQLCADLGCVPNHMMAAIAFETAETFSPSVRNRVSGATGLIQFMSSTARNLDTTTDALAALTAEDQLEYVDRYFRPFRGHLSTVEDVYMAILWPRAVGQANDFGLFTAGTAAYDQNFYLDLDEDGVITKYEASAHVAAKLQKGLQSRFLA